MQLFVEERFSAALLKIPAGGADCVQIWHLLSKFQCSTLPQHVSVMRRTESSASCRTFTDSQWGPGASKHPPLLPLSTASIRSYRRCREYQASDIPLGTVCYVSRRTDRQSHMRSSGLHNLVSFTCATERGCVEETLRPKQRNKND